MNRPSRSFVSIVLSVMLICMGMTEDAQAQPIAGQAVVIDGDTLEIGGQRIRLVEIDAPESAQTCQLRSGRDWPCGRRAAFALADHIGRSHVACTFSGNDRYGRVLARCTSGGADLGAWLIRQGWALPYYGRSSEYLRAAQLAESDGVGIWAGTFEAPQKWRRMQRCSYIVPRTGEPC